MRSDPRYIKAMRILIPMVLLACSPSSERTDAWDGSWAVDEHLEGPGCGYPTVGVEEAWASVELQLFEGPLLALTPCSTEGCQSVPSFTVDLEIAQTNLLTSENVLTGLLDGSTCSVVWTTILASQEVEGQASFHIQQYTGTFPTNGSDDCAERGEELVGEVCDLTTHLELSR